MSTILQTREHPYITLRKTQLNYNSLAVDGGKPYLDARLTRAPNESDLSWFGNSSSLLRSCGLTTEGVKSRIERSAVCNDAGRVSDKINQYLFKSPAVRTGIDEDWAQRVDGKALTIGDFWASVSEQITIGRWCWICVSRLPSPVDAEGNPRTRTLLERKQDADYVQWTLWPNTSVPDWRFGADGKLDWILTESDLRIDLDPNVEAKTVKIRTLYKRVGCVVTVTEIAKDGNTEGLELRTDEPIQGLNEIPFVCIGKPSEKPWWFDNIEMMLCQMVNLDSISSDNMLRAAFPQLVCPQSVFDSAETSIREGAYHNEKGEKVAQIVREIVRGGDHPMGESPEDKGCTRYISPDPNGMKIIPEEINRKRGLLFENAGLALFNKETRQTQTAESKQFDQLDTESTLAHRASIMQDAETKLVAFSLLIDPNFGGYTPVWPNKFDVPDIASLSNFIQVIGNVPDMPLSMQKISKLLICRIMQENGGIDPDLIEQARKEIMAMTEPEEEEGAGEDDNSESGAGDGAGEDGKENPNKNGAPKDKGNTNT